MEIETAMTLFGPTLTEYLPAWPPAPAPGYWLLVPEDIPLLSSRIPWAGVELREPEMLEWVELGARMRMPLTDVEYRCMNSASRNEQEYQYGAENEWHAATAPAIARLAERSQRWVMSKLPTMQTIGISPIGLVYRVPIVSWEGN